jgi:hypothetical protein
VTATADEIEEPCQNRVTRNIERGDNDDLIVGEVFDVEEDEICSDVQFVQRPVPFRSARAGSWSGR